MRLWTAALVVAGARADLFEGAASVPTGPQCDMSFDGTLCLGKQVVLPAAAQAGLVGHWSFDELEAVDQSGRSNHAKGLLVGSHSAMGSGAAASFAAGRFLVVPHSTDFTGGDFSFSSWIFVNAGLSRSLTAATKARSWCPLIKKGLSTATGVGEQFAPAILLDTSGSGSLKVLLSTTSTAQGEFLTSNARLKAGQWYHLAVARDNAKKKLRLYVNGVLDSGISTVGFTAPNQFPLYLGGDAVSAKLAGCAALAFSLDEVKMYSRPLHHDEIQADAGGVLPGVEPSYLRLACTACTLQDTAKGCQANKGFHVCSSLELQAGAHVAAKALGWLASSKAHVWTQSKLNAMLQEELGLDAESATDADVQEHVQAPTPAPAPAVPTKGLGLCCAD